MKMEYEELFPITRAELADGLASSDSSLAARGILRMALHEGDLAWAEQRCLSALGDTREDVKRAAVQGLGHLARIHGKLTSRHVVEELQKLTSVPELAGVVDDVLDDIRIFSEQES